MYCHKCGEKIADQSKFCPHCGAKVLASEDRESVINQKARQKAQVTNSEESRMVRLLPVLIPIISLLLVSAGLAIYYFQEKETNDVVLQLKKSAEETALKQDYQKAKKLIEQALTKRPDYSALTVDLEAIEKAIQIEKGLGNVGEKIKKTEFDDANKELANLKEQMKENKDPIFTPLQKQISDKEISITVGTIKKELNEISNVEELGGKLSILATLPEQEAGAVKQEILNKIVQISTDEAENKLANKQFSEAFSTIDNGLQYAVNDENLLSLKERVEQDKNAFEQAEQQRIEKAMEAAAQEDLKNKTTAAKVTDLSVELSQFGDLYIKGSVNNTATTEIYSITIYYSIYDVNHTFLDNGSTSVYPYYLQSGQSGAFTDTYYGAYQNATVEIDNITWYLK